MKRIHYAVLHDTVNPSLDLTKVIKVDDLRVPIVTCFGHFEALTDEELDDLLTDLNYERYVRDREAESGDSARAA